LTKKARPKSSNEIYTPPVGLEPTTSWYLTGGNPQLHQAY